MAAKTSLEGYYMKNKKQSSLRPNAKKLLPVKYCYVYALVHVEEDKVFYVGQSEDLYSRFCSHLCVNNVSTMSPVNLKIRKLFDRGQTVIIRPLTCGLSRSDALIMETNYIKHFGLHKLCNLIAQERNYESNYFVATDAETRD